MTSSLPKDPGQARAAAIYGQIARNPGKAWKEARAAQKTFPKSERLRFVAGLALIALGKKPEAKKQFADAIKLGTPAPDAYLNLALLSAETGRLDFALDTLERAEARFGEDVQVATARVNAYRAGGDPGGALEAAEKARAAHPEAAELQLLYAVLLSEAGRLLTAIEVLERLLERQPDHVIARINLGRFLAFTNQPAHALEVTEQAYALAPTLPVVLENLAIRRREAGDFTGAAALFSDLVALAPVQAPEALRQLADIAPETQLAALSQEIDTRAGQVRGLGRAQLGFARAAIAKRQGDDPGFARALKEANRTLAKLRPYAARADKTLHESALAQFDSEAPAPVTEAPALPATPIFIMGLPRSGTTLLERMLSAAPETSGLGEVALINRYIASRLASGTPLAAGLGDLRRDYAAYQTLAGQARWSIDKMPANYVHMGWIARAFPEARLILMQRDPRDVALSIYEAYFDDPGQNFAFTEDGIRTRLALFEETKAAWRARGIDCFDVAYEDLVSTPEATLRRIATHCGLPYDPAMLKPEDNTGSIRTASNVQARREINRDSIARWERYPDLLPGIFG